LNKTSNGRRSFLWPWGAVVILLTLWAGTASYVNAQIATTTATLSGVVTDSSGAVLPQASLVLASAEKGIIRTFTTDAGGRYSFNQLPPATYNLTIKARGFQTYEQRGIVLDAAETGTQNVTLTVGVETQSVTVTADASQLNTDNSNVATNIDAKQIVELPLNVRNIYGLATLNSSVQNSSETQMLRGGGGGGTTDTADQDISFLNFAGGFFGTTAYMVDGSWDTDSEWGGIIFVPGVEAVQEFKVQNNSFTAQYGWSTGNVVNVITKGGTRDFHGSVYEFYSNNSLNAFSYFNNPAGCVSHNQNVCAFSRNQTGGAAGGPLYIPGLYKQRDKTFIFGHYEHFTADTPTPSSYTVPDTSFRGGDFSEILGTTPEGTDALGRPIYPGQIYDPRSGRAITAGAVDPVTGLTATQTGFIRDPIPGNLLSNLAGYTPDTIGAKLLSYYPAAQTQGNTANNLIVSASAPSFWDEYGIRVDHNINPATTAYFRYSYKKETKASEAATWGSDPAGPGNTVPNNRWGMWAGLTRIFSPTFTMNIASGVQIWHEDFSNQSFGFNAATEIGLPAYVGQNAPLFPAVTVAGFSPLGPAINSPQANTNHGPIGTVATDFIKLHGKNTLNFGFMGVEQVFSQHNFYPAGLTFNSNFSTGPNPLTPSAATGNAVAEMLLGTLSAGTIQTNFNPYESNHLLGEYFQDDWKPVHNLTLNLGIRYEVQTPYTFRHNTGSIFDPTAQNPLGTLAGRPLLGALQFLGPGNRYTYNPNYRNIAPRVGFTYQPLPKAAFHGGYGIFYPESVTSSGAADSDGFSATTNANTSLDGRVTPNPNISTSNPWGGQYAQITGNANGSFQQLGNSVGSDFKNRPSPYVQQWMLGLEYAFTPNDQLEVNYIGNRGIRMIGAPNGNQLNPKYLFTAGGQSNANFLSAPAASNPFAAPLQALELGGTIASSACNLDNANVTNAQLLAPFPQYCGVGQTDAPVGQSLYNSLQVNYNHRISKGLTALVSYTYSKFLDNVEGNNSWSYNSPAYSSGTVANNYNLAAEKSVDAGDVPQALVASYSYKLPIGRGRAVGSGMNRLADAVVGGWEITGVTTFREGIPIQVGGADWNSFGGSPRPNVTGNPKLSKPSLKEWFNTGAFAYAPYGSFGTAPRYFSNLRGPHFQNWDTNLEKNWSFGESMRAQFRFETFNSFNHPNFYAPGNTTYSGCDPNATSTCSPGFGQISAAFPGRIVQFAGKFYW
jgi:hypothetical protein